MFKGGGGEAHSFFDFVREKEDLTSHMHRGKGSRKEKTREVNRRTFNAGRSRAQDRRIPVRKDQE